MRSVPSTAVSDPELKLAHVASGSSSYRLRFYMTKNSFVVDESRIGPVPHWYCAIFYYRTFLNF